MYFCYVMIHLTIAQAIVFDIDWSYTLAWFAASLLITRKRLSKIGVRFGYARRRYIAMADVRHALVPCNSHHFVVYGQKHQVWVLLFLVRTS